MKVEVGKIRLQFVTLPKAMLSVGRTANAPMAGSFWRFGQLYAGYWGLYTFYGRWYINFWWHHVER